MSAANTQLENLEMGLFDASHSELLDNQSKGTTLMETESICLSLAFAEYLNKVYPYVSRQYSNAVVNGKSYPLSFGLGGSSNPKNLSLHTFPESGTVYNIASRSDGYVIIYSKFNLGKSYYVFDTEGPIAYTLGFVTADGTSLAYSLPNDKDGKVDLNSSQIGQYVDSELRLKPISEIDSSLFLEGSASGFIMFPVEMGKNYMICADGSKMNCGGYIFSRTKPKNVGFSSDSGEYFDLIGDHLDNFNIESGGVMALDITGLNGMVSTHKLTDETVVSFKDGSIGIGNVDGIKYRYSITDLKNIKYSTKTVYSLTEITAANKPVDNIPFYIYRNDGVINTFFSDEVEKFTYSHFDEDSIQYDGLITQQIHTRDTICSINIQLIDSISFAAPKTVFNKDVVFLDKGLKDYFLFSDGNDITFSKNTPDDIMPAIGSILVQMNPDENFDQPFFGRVVGQTQTDKGICVTCKNVELTEVFDSYCATFVSTGSDSFTRAGSDSIDGCRILTGGMELNFDLTQIPGVTYIPDEDIAEVFGINSRAEFSPRIDYLINYRGALVIDKAHGVNLRVNIDSDYDLSTVLEVMRELNVSKKWKFLNIPLPIPTPLLSVDLEVGAFIEAAASLIFKNQTTDKFNCVFNWEWSNTKDLSQNNFAAIRRIDSKRNLTGVVSGQFSFGGYVALNIHPVRLGIVNISPEYKFGLKLASPISLNWNINQKGPDEMLYKTLEANPLGVYWTRSFNLSFEFGKPGVSTPLFPNVSTLNGDTPIYTMRHVPSFKNTVAKYDRGELAVSTDIQNKVIYPVQLGFALVNDINKEVVETQYKVGGYTESPANMEHIFKVDLSEASYTVIPLIKWRGIEMFGFPSARYLGLCPDEDHPHLIDLGLPSKKMWSCCNHGASSPDASGLYLAWGESSEKSYYKYRTYQFWNDKNDNDRWDEGEFDDIGSNIQRTEYDPVHASDNRLGMPTKEEYQELISNCKWEPYTYNDQKGSLLIGPNGKHLFLPAVGMMVDYDLVQNGNGRYWTSNVDPADHCDALLLSFSDSNAEFVAGDRHNGRTIRPIALDRSSVDEMKDTLSESLVLKVINRVIQITAPEECTISIATIDGIYSFHKLSPGLNELQMAPGFYVIDGQKVIIK